jgi:hypothetical protein
MTDNEVIYTEEFQTEFEKANRLFNKITWIETTPENLRELAARAIKLAEMIENGEE